MAGSPLKRRRKEAVAKQALKAEAAKLEALTGPERTEYTPELATQIAELIADGVPIDDTKIGGDVVALGVASQVRVSTRTLYRWQEAHADFAEKIDRARKESAHRLGDRINALAQLALDQPAMANAVKVAASLYQWSAGVRNREYYGEKLRVEVAAPDLAEKLRRARERVVSEPEAERPTEPAALVH